jgi:predicted dehydrogenase
MLAAAERARVKHMVQFTNRGLPHYRWIKHLLEDGYIGMPYGRLLQVADGLVSGTAAEFVLLVG